MTPDGFMSFLAGPVDRSVRGWLLWNESGLERCMRSTIANVSSSEQLDFYRNPADYGGYGIVGAYRARPHVPLTDGEKSFYTEMSRLRIFVEHSFGLCLFR
jgi:hypothetical protein